MAGIGSGIARDPRKMQPGMDDGDADEQPGAPPSADDGDGDEQQMQSQPGDEESGEGEDPNSQTVTPEEQAEYDQFVNNALEVIYPQGERGQMSKAVQAHLQGQFEPEVQQMLQKVDPPVNPQSPIDNIAATGVLIVTFLEGSASQSGKQMDNGIVYHAGSEIIQVLANDGEEAGFFNVDEKDIEHAFYRAIDMYRFLSPNADQAQLSGEFEQIAQADKAGQLGKVLPGIGQAEQQQGA